MMAMRNISAVHCRGSGKLRYKAWLSNECKVLALYYPPGMTFTADRGRRFSNRR